MQGDIPALGWLVVTALGALALGAALAWAVSHYRTWRVKHGSSRPTDATYPAPTPTRERYSRMEIKAAEERNPADPMSPKARNISPLAIMMVAALMLAGAALAVMFVNNANYDGTSPIEKTGRR
jgi:hypothetical protein